MIKAIETQYQGYRFRSRLEARWAVFFDALGVEWEYEPEGFDLGHEGKYLPDFYLPGLDCHAEIKPNTEWPEMAGFGAVNRRLRQFADCIGPIVGMCGVPELSAQCYAFCHDLSDSSGGCYESECGWTICPVCSHATLGMLDARLLHGRRDLFRDPCMSEPWHICAVDHFPVVWGQDDEVTRAIIAARGARFEHGENGTRRHR